MSNSMVAWNFNVLALAFTMLISRTFFNLFYLILGVLIVPDLKKKKKKEL